MMTTMSLRLLRGARVGEVEERGLEQEQQGDGEGEEGEERPERYGAW